MGICDYYKLFCYRNTKKTNEDDIQYVNGIAFVSGGNVVELMERPYRITVINNRFKLEDVHGRKFQFSVSNTSITREEIISILTNCNCCFDENRLNPLLTLTDNENGSITLKTVDETEEYTVQLDNLFSADLTNSTPKLHNIEADFLNAVEDNVNFGFADPTFSQWAFLGSSNGFSIFHNLSSGRGVGISTSTTLEFIKILTGQDLSTISQGLRKVLMLQSDQSAKWETVDLENMIAESSDFTIDQNYSIAHILASKSTAQFILIPLNSTESIPIGFKFNVAQKGEGEVKLLAETGVTILRKPGKEPTTASINSKLFVVKEKENTWGAYEDLKDLPEGYDYVGDSIGMFSPSETSINSLYWPRVYKSSKWPEFGISEPYFTIYSTDHANLPGYLNWGTMDDPFFTNFVEQGTIATGDQPETSWLMRMPADSSGNTIFLYYHTFSSEPGNGGFQQTRLITTSGGALPHLATWEDRGRPLGLEPDEDHTGYCTVHKRGDADYVALHLAIAGGVGQFRYSYSADGLTFTREGDIPETVAITNGEYTKGSLVYPFYRNGELLGFKTYRDNDGFVWMSAAKLNSDFIWTDLHKNAVVLGHARDYGVYIENETAYIHSKTGSNYDNGRPYVAYAYDLSHLDFQSDNITDISNSMVFNGMTDYLEAESADDFQFNLPIEIQFKTNDNSSNFVLLSKWNGSGNVGRFLIHFDYNNSRFGINYNGGSGTGFQDRYFSFVPVIGQTYKYRMYFDDDELVQEIDDVEQSRVVTTNLPTVNNPSKLQVGRTVLDSGYFDGTIDYIKFASFIFLFPEGSGATTKSQYGWKTLEINGATWQS